MMDLDILIDHGLSRFQLCSNLLAALCSRLLDLFQGHFPIAEFSTDRAAEEAVLVKHMSFTHVSRVESDQNLFLDKGRQGDVHVAVILEMNAILLDPACLGYGEQQQVKLVQRRWHPRHKSACFPSFLGVVSRFAMGSAMIVFQ